MGRIRRGIDRAVGAMGLQRKSVSNPWADQVFFKSLRQLMSGVTAGATKPFVQSTWVYASVSKIANNISNVPLKLYKPSEDEDDDKVEVTEHELLEILANPNPYMTGQQLIEATEIFMGLRGEAIWILENRENVTQIPERIWCFDPARFEPVVDKQTGTVLGWKYNGIKAFVFPMHQILHFKKYNPYNDIRGLAPLEAARDAIDQDFFANKFNLQFFKGGASISGFVEVDDTMQDKAYKRFKEQLNEQTEGVDQAHTIGVLEGGAKFKETKLSQKDMEYIKGKKVTREEIFAVYGTNSVVLGLYEDIKSYEGIKTAHKVFWQETLTPKMGYQETILNEKFIGPITGGSLWVKYDLADVPALQEDFKNKIESAEGLMKLGYPANMINRRLDLGMEDLDWGDSWFYPGHLISTDDDTGEEGAVAASYNPTRGLTVNDVIRFDRYLSSKKGTKLAAPGEPLEIDAEVTESPVIKGFDAIESMVREAASTAKEKSEVQTKQDEEQDKIDETAWRDYLAIQKPVEKKFLQGIRGYFFKQRKRVLDSLFEYYGEKSADEIRRDLGFIVGNIIEVDGKKTYATTRDLTDDIMDSQREEEALKKTITPLYTVAVATGVKHLADSVGDVDFVFDPLDEDFLGPMNLRITKIPPIVVGTVKTQLRETLVEGIGEGASVNELAERVKDVYRVSSSRALTIARTESSSSINAGRFEYMRKKGYGEHRWLSARDGKERATHGNMNTSIAKVGELFKFVKGGSTGIFTELKFPGDPHASAEEVINCRCVTLPVIPGVE